ncbi:hypothetical protein [Actinoplanes utahensis]|uniref:hypothetical protein n=1 Tax=Actinoplanes utahensis TaxID=1869 RepID=UPI000B049664|nr:hypothetical protein [Actinoplanes utahensis]GIF32636.1 hypothetical protein Aut01nite_56220 [Actinoplanes utahensis]
MNVRADTPGRRRILEALVGLLPALSVSTLVAAVLLPPIVLRTSRDRPATGDRVE